MYFRAQRRNSSVSIAASLLARGQRKVTPYLGKGKRFICSPNRPEGLWVSSRILFNWYWEIFPQGLFGLGLKLTFHYLASWSLISILPYSLIAWITTILFYF